MVRQTLVLIAVLVSLALAGAALAAQVPVAVSPGSASRVALIGDGCPTFSWGAAEGARGHELVVYRLAEEGEEAQPVLSESFAGSASSWTPSLERCLERGGRYAWSVRSVGGKEASEWSALSLFEVTSGPSEAEFEQAVEVMRSYLAARGEDAVAAPRERSASPREGSPVSSEPPSPLALPAATQLSVDGNIAATSYTGDGENLDNVATDAEVLTLLCTHQVRRYLDQGNGTVLDCNTGLFWLKDASCADLAGTDGAGQGDWAIAESAAAALADGTCGLTDDSEPGAWRQPTIDEFCSAWAGSGLIPCPPTAASDSLVDSSLGAPYVSNAAGTGLWSAGDAFVGVQQSAGYWSATDRNLDFAWLQFLNDGVVFELMKSSDNFVWPVRSGQ